MTSRSTALLVASAGLLAATSDAFAPQASSMAVRSVTNLRALEKEEDATTKEEPVYYNILSQADPVQQTTSPTAPVTMIDTDPQFSEAAMAASAAIATSYESTSSTIPVLNGWTPKPDYALWGLPGAILPLGYFDPIGFARQGLPLNDAKRLREAEVQHGRVAMMATVGYLAQETIVGGGPFRITGPANDMLQQVPLIPFVVLSVTIGTAEVYRARRGWVEPKFKIGSNTLFTLRDTYYPGDLGFDPLGLKPTDDYEYQKMQTKELSNGRLAMLGWAGMCAQELMNHKTIGETLEFYSKVYSGDYYY